jgi:nucleolin
MKAPQHSLQDTRYGKLEMNVQRIIQKQQKRSREDSAPARKPTTEGKNQPAETDDGNERKKQNIEKRSAAIVRNPSVLHQNDPLNSYTNDKTVYVQGFPFSCEEDDIRKLFEVAGEIKSIRLPRWHDSGKLKGYGHIEFKSRSGAVKALEMTGQYIQDRYITVDRPMVPRALAALSSETASKHAAADSDGEGDREEVGEANIPTLKVEKPAGCRTVFIKNLPYEISEDEIRQSFMVYGPIMNVRLAVWYHTQNKKGFGYIDFKREDSAEIAVKKSGSIKLKDRIILVDFETKAPKKGFKAQNGKRK